MFVEQPLALQCLLNKENIYILKVDSKESLKLYLQGLRKDKWGIFDEEQDGNIGGCTIFLYYIFWHWGLPGNHCLNFTRKSFQILLCQLFLKDNFFIPSLILLQQGICQSNLQGSIPIFQI